MADILESLEQIDAKVFDLIVNGAPVPGDATQTLQMKHLVAIHTQLSSQIDQLTLHQAQLSVQGLTDLASRLGKINAEIQAATSTIADVGTVLNCAAQAVGAAAGVVAIVAAL